MEKYKLRSVIRKKRGGLDVSVNSIVVLIFAVIILSLGIAFIKNMFGKASNQFLNIDKQVQANMQKKLATSSEKVILSQDDLSLSPGGKADIYIGIKNYFNSPKTFGILNGGKLNSDGSVNNKKSTIACFGASLDNGKDSSPYIKDISFGTVKEYKINAGESEVFKVVVRADRNTPTGTYYCEAAIIDPTNSNNVYGKYQIAIDVESSQ